MGIAWVFPGQGSQKAGMAAPVLALPGARDRFAAASELLGRDLLAICAGAASGTAEPSDLNDTRNTQPALFVIESLLVDQLRDQGRQADLVAGHSLGELVALYAKRQAAPGHAFSPTRRGKPRWRTPSGSPRPSTS